MGGVNYVRMTQNAMKETILLVLSPYHFLVALPLPE